MMLRTIAFGIGLAILSACTTAPFRGPAGAATSFPVKPGDASNPFGQAAKPSHGSTHVIGGYAAGCIAGAKAMPMSGRGWEVVRLSRNRNWGHPTLLSLLARAGKALPKGRSPLVLGDLAQPRGGPMVSGHSSHQLGLDVDIWFYLHDAGQPMTDEEREHPALGTVLNPDFITIDEKKWSDQFDEQLLWFAGQDEVERIFVNVAIKKRLCQKLGAGDARLIKLRPWFGHDDHYHVRLRCPSSEGDCVPQKAPAGVECDEKDLKYWYSDEVIDGLKNPKPEPAKTVHVPIACQGVLAAPAAP